MDNQSVFQPLLQPGEEIRWTGRPRFSLDLSPQTRGLMTLTAYLIILAAWFYWLFDPSFSPPDTSVEISFSQTQKEIDNSIFNLQANEIVSGTSADIHRVNIGNDILWYIIGFWLLYFLYQIFLNIFRIWRSLTRFNKTYYCLTDRRAIIVENRRPFYWAAMNIAYDTPVALAETRRGSTHVSFGRRYDFDTEDWPMFRGFSFFNIPDADTVLTIVEEMRRDYLDFVAYHIKDQHDPEKAVSPDLSSSSPGRRSFEGELPRKT